MMNKNMALLRKMGQNKVWMYVPIKRNVSTSTSERVKEQSSDTYESISKFYAGQSVFITGGTGFIGKVVVEKLLRSCPDIGRIYLLIRANSELHAKERCEEMINGSKQLFSRLKKEHPQNISKIVPIVGDLGKFKLGIKTKDEEELLKNVSIVIHMGVIIKFNEHPRVALKCNVEGTREVLKLSQRMKNIKALVHVSSLYCVANPDREYIEETFYPPSFNTNTVFEHMNKNYNSFSPVTYGYNNTYVMTKALSEQIVVEEHGDVPTAVIRPSVVQSSLNEPFEGWIDSLSLLSFYITSIARGHIRVLMGDNNTIVDVIPVDYVANMIIVAAARSKKVKEVDIYNCASSFCNPVKLIELCRNSVKYSVKYGYNAVPYPGVKLTKSKWLFNILEVSTELLPAYVYDLWLQIQGKPKKFVKTQKLVMFLRNINRYYTENSWKAKVDKARELHQTMDSKEQMEFPCDPVNISWKEYLPVNFRGNFKASSKID